MPDSDSHVPQPLATAASSQIAEGYRYCSAVVRRAAGNFYYAFLLLPKVQRNAIHALYAFCRAGDDAVDHGEPGVDPRRDLENIRKKLDLCYDGFYIDLPSVALADSIRRYEFERADFDDLLLGMESDLEEPRFRTEEDQALYCYRVASTVGLLCLKIFGVNDGASRIYAIELGKGMQITNILRDLQEDRERRRVYLPESDLRSAGLTRESLFEPDVSERLRSVVSANIERARGHYTVARTAMPREHARKLIAARAMGAIYETILERIEANPCGGKRIELTRREKLGIVHALVG